MVVGNPKLSYFLENGWEKSKKTLNIVYITAGWAHIIVI